MKQLYMVGGCVRDRLLGIEPKDIDYVAVGYKPEEFSHLQRVGKDFPVFLDKDGCEIALARVERSVGDGYNDFEMHTENVTLEEDLSRRDLTINAIAIPYQSQLDIIDPFNGEKDIREKVLRHVSDAFAEDPVRVLRLARFKATLGGYWKIAPETKALVYKMKLEGKLASLTKERIYKEVIRVMELGRAVEFFYVIHELGVLDVLFPELFEMLLTREGSKYHAESSVFEHTMMVLKNLKHKDILSQLSGLYHDVLKPKTYREHGNGNGHEAVELDDLPDWIPLGTRGKLVRIIRNHLYIHKLEDLRPSKVVKIMREFRRGSKGMQELQALINLGKADASGRVLEKGLKSSKGFCRFKVLRIYKAVNSAKLPERFYDRSAECKMQEFLQEQIRAVKAQLKD